MGADGGTKPTRGEQVKTKKSETSKPKALDNLRWSTCVLSGNNLDFKAGVAVDPKGNLLNVEAVLEHYLDPEKKKTLRKYNHIKSKKDIVELKFEKLNPKFVAQRDFPQDSSMSSSSNDFQGPFICPITGDVSNGTLRFDAFVPCGHLASHKALVQLYPSISISSSSNCDKSLEQSHTEVKKIAETQVDTALFDCPTCASKVTKLIYILPPQKIKCSESNDLGHSASTTIESSTNSSKKRPPPTVIPAAGQVYSATSTTSATNSHNPSMNIDTPIHSSSKEDEEPVHPPSAKKIAVL